MDAVRGIDFEVQADEVFGLLGPNGAGKTTTVEILEGLRPRSGGDPDRQKNALKDRIGVCLQPTNLPDKRRVHEASLIVDGNPLQDVHALSSISTVFFKGGRVVRSDLFDQK